MEGGKWWKQVTVEGDRVIMIPYRREHVPKYHIWMKDPMLLELTGSEPLSLEEEYEMQGSWASDPNKCTFIVLDRNQICEEFSLGTPHVEGGLVRKMLNEVPYDDTTAMAGDVNLFLNDIDDPSTAELEIMIAEPASRGKGMGKEAVQLMMSFASKFLGISTFRVKIGNENVASVGLFKSLGFEQVAYSDVFKQITLEVSANEVSLLKELKLLGADHP